MQELCPPEWTKGVGTHVGEGIVQVRPASKMRGVGGDQRRTEVVATLNVEDNCVSTGHGET